MTAWSQSNKTKSALNKKFGFQALTPLGCCTNGQRKGAEQGSWGRAPSACSSTPVNHSRERFDLQKQGDVTAFNTNSTDMPARLFLRCKPTRDLGAYYCPLTLNCTGYKRLVHKGVPRFILATESITWHFPIFIFLALSASLPREPPNFWWRSQVKPSF